MSGFERAYDDWKTTEPDDHPPSDAPDRDRHDDDLWDRAGEMAEDDTEDIPD